MALENKIMLTFFNSPSLHRTCGKPNTATTHSTLATYRETNKPTKPVTKIDSQALSL